MSTLHPTEDFSVLDAHDWAIPCGYSSHRGDEVATLAVWYHPVECGHWRTRFLYFCEPCWVRRSSYAWVRCRTGEHFYRPMETIRRVERI